MQTHIKKQKTIFGFNPYFKYGKPGSFTPGFSVLKLTGTPYTFESQRTEVFILILNGELSITIENPESVYHFKRGSVFSDPPSGLYIPPETKVSIQALSDPTEAAFCFSSELYIGKNEAKTPTVCKKGPSDVSVTDVGRESFRRKVTTVCGAEGETYTLIIGETLSDGGMWSSYPPHKHEKNELPAENKLKEIYYYRINPPHGFGFQGIYSDVSGTESAYMIRDGDAIFIANGYHPVSAAPGYQLYYLWVLCGQVPSVVWKVDEKHAWLENQ
jgi:5-deoxy-glucuronate isomerase